MKFNKEKRKKIRYLRTENFLKKVLPLTPSSAIKLHYFYTRDIDNHPAITFCNIMLEKETIKEANKTVPKRTIIATGFSICSAKDALDKEQGKDKALERALENLHILQRGIKSSGRVFR